MVVAGTRFRASFRDGCRRRIIYQSKVQNDQFRSGFRHLGNTVVKAIEQMIIKIAIVEPLMRGLQSAFFRALELARRSTSC
jgi:hypothetical protein